MLLEHRRAGPVAGRRDGLPTRERIEPCAPQGAVSKHSQAFRRDASIGAVVLHGTGSGFCAGGDRSEFGTPDATRQPTLSRDVLGAIEACGKPVVAAMHGFAVGGGLELALACNARIAVAGTRVGLPEVKIGVFPLSATQRLPRLLGLARATDLMMEGTLHSAESAETSLLFDRIVAAREDLLAAAVQLAQTAVIEPPPHVRERQLPDPAPGAELRRVLQHYPEALRTPAQNALVAALAAAIESPDFQAGLDRAQELFDTLGGNRRSLRP